MSQDSPVFSVGELTENIKSLLENSFGVVAVEGEISNYRPSSAGHAYFTLKDDRAQISAVMFRGKARNVPFAPADGMLVRITGVLTVYPQRGNYQIMVDTMENAGVGAILVMLEERKKRLADEGLFDQQRKRALPQVPRVIGVVTSPTGAALRDILHITRRRNNSVSVIVFPCLVQGMEAPPQITKMIQAANAWKLCDVLIVGRGGGSLEDLLPFSDESVVRAVFESEIPVVSAVGHEIDWSLCDFASDARAPTPSGAAEIAVPVKSDLLGEIAYNVEVFERAVQSRLERMRLAIKSFTPESLELAFRNIEQPLLANFDDAKMDLLQNMKARTDALRQRVERSAQILEGANPKAILERGYAFVRDADTKKIIRKSADVNAGSRIEIIPSEGMITAQVIEN
jgi:exodeoxyribonuclease VII large subunit